MTQVKSKRKNLTKKVRFEVFKRDSFQCQYCGKSAPDVVLNVDHIKPVSKGGDNEIMNLVTSCFDCNSGKSDREIDDQSILAKQKRQIDEINERREQLKMLHEYRDSVTDIDEEKTLYITDMINAEIAEHSINDVGIRIVKQWVKKFEYKHLLDAIEKGFKQYIKFDSEGVVVPGTVETFFKRIPGITRNLESGAAQPNKDAYYIRGIIRNRFSYINERMAVELIIATHECGVPYETIKDFAKEAKNWSHFRGSLEATIASSGGEE